MTHNTHQESQQNIDATYNAGLITGSHNTVSPVRMIQGPAYRVELVRKAAEKTRGTYKFPKR